MNYDYCFTTNCLSIRKTSDAQARIVRKVIRENACKVKRSNAVSVVTTYCDRETFRNIMNTLFKYEAEKHNKTQK